MIAIKDENKVVKKILLDMKTWMSKWVVKEDYEFC